MHYTSVNEAAKLLRERQQAGARDRVMEWVIRKGFGGLPFPTIPHMAVLGRHVATCRYEDIVFTLMAKQAGLVPTWMEYTADTFVTCSPVKKSLLHPFMCDGKGRRGGFRTRKKKLADPHRWDGARLCDIQLADGTGLVEWHHAHQDMILGADAIRNDASDFLSKFRGSREYYPAYLAAFVAHAVLFEDYHGGESGDRLDGFTTGVFEPAWRTVRDEIGLAPLIVPLPWWKGLELYPADAEWRQHDVIDVERLAA